MRCTACGFDKARPRVWPFHCRCGAVLNADGELIGRDITSRVSGGMIIVTCPVCNKILEVKKLPYRCVCGKIIHDKDSVVRQLPKKEIPKDLPAEIVAWLELEQ